MNELDFEFLLFQAWKGHTQDVLEAVDQDSRLATRADNKVERTLLHEACLGGHMKLARGLLARGASVRALDTNGSDATYYASGSGNVDVVTLLLDHGGDVNTRNNMHCTALMFAAQKGHLAVCLLLLARGADLMIVSKLGSTALESYGRNVYPPLSPEVLAEGRAAMIKAWEHGPHPIQQSIRWARRLPIMLFVTGCRFRPLDGKQGWIPPEGLSLEQRERARRRILVFSSDLLLRLIVSFL